MTTNEPKAKNYNTEMAINDLVAHVVAGVRDIRAKGSDIFALQALNFILSNNPQMALASEDLQREIKTLVTSIHGRLRRIFRDAGGQGPEVIDRLIGPEKAMAIAGTQALSRIMLTMDRAYALANGLEPGGDGGPQTAEGHVGQATVFSSPEDQMREALFDLARSGQAGPRDIQKLEALRARLRARLTGQNPDKAAPWPLDNLDLDWEPEDVALASILRPSGRSPGLMERDEKLVKEARELARMALETGEVTVPATTDRERAIWLLAESHFRPLTPVELGELGV